MAYEFQYVENFQLLDKPVQLQASGVWECVRLSGVVGGLISKTFAGERRVRKKNYRTEQKEREKAVIMRNSEAPITCYNAVKWPETLTWKYLKQVFQANIAFETPSVTIYQGLYGGSTCYQAKMNSSGQCCFSLFLSLFSSVLILCLSVGKYTHLANSWRDTM